MQRPESVIACVNCGATISEAYSEVAGWRYSSDGVGELQSFCELCSAREFAPDAPASALSFYLASYYCGEAPLWRLDCGHEIPLLEHERPTIHRVGSGSARSASGCGTSVSSRSQPELVATRRRFRGSTRPCSCRRRQ